MIVLFTWYCLLHNKVFDLGQQSTLYDHCIVLKIFSWSTKIQHPYCDNNDNDSSISSSISISSSTRPLY
ncbi:MAG: hypothetical protein ACI8RD_013930 [Bacillariaceae sp.]|jgi:hypothetical protein